MTRAKQWVTAGLILGACLGLLCFVMLVTPRAPTELQPGDPNSFPYTLDPHLFIEILEASLEDAGPGGGELRATLRASNTAVGDLSFHLGDFRVASQTPDGHTGEPATLRWRLAGSGLLVQDLAPGSTATATARLNLPRIGARAALLIWRENAASRALPFTRGSMVCPTMLYRVKPTPNTPRSPSQE